MNKEVLKQLQFGFEIEGLFSDDLKDEVDGEFQDDGSVHFDSSSRDKILKLFEPLRFDGESQGCDNCHGEGHYNEDCQCEYDVDDCQHEHNGDCGAISENDVVISRNCTHECSDDCYRRPCDSDDDYHWVECSECDGSGEGSSGESEAKEYASPVYRSLDGLQNHMNKFSEDKHAWNDSCGLHFHVSTKEEKDWKKFWNAVANLDLLSALHKQATTWCECQRKRLLYSDDQYYSFWHNPYSFNSCFNKKYPARDFHTDMNTKFKFMRFHDEDDHSNGKPPTLEFRFLSPCKHKTENVEKLLSFLTDYLGSDETVETFAEALNQPNKVTLEISVPIRKAGRYVLHHGIQTDKQQSESHNRSQTQARRFGNVETEPSWDFYPTTEIAADAIHREFMRGLTDAGRERIRSSISAS